MIRIILLVIPFLFLSGCNSIDKETTAVIGKTVKKIAIRAIINGFVIKNPDLEPYIYMMAATVNGNAQATSGNVGSSINEAIDGFNIDNETKNLLRVLGTDLVDVYVSFIESNASKIKENEKLKVLLMIADVVAEMTSEAQFTASGKGIVLDKLIIVVE